MSLSEKQDNNFEKKEDNDNDNRSDDTHIEENKNQKKIKNNNNKKIKGKNRTLQYYKFLFYTMKTEIKVHDFLKLIRTSNTTELSIWTISVVLFANIPEKFPILKKGEYSTTKYNGVFIWFHIFHIVRAFLGMYIGYILPRSYQIMEALQNIPDEILEKTLFNDIIRETLLNKVILVIKQKKVYILIYLICTILNTIIDAIEFFYILMRLSNLSSSAKVVFITYLFIVIIYLVVDFSYFFWLGQLRYIFPQKYLRSLNDLYHGIIYKAISTFKLKKPKIDIVNEVKIQHKSQPRKKEAMNNGGFNLLEHILKDSLEVEKYYNNNKYLPDVKNENRNKGNIKEGIQDNFPNSNEILN